MFVKLYMNEIIYKQIAFEQFVQIHDILLGIWTKILNTHIWNPSDTSSGL